MANKQDHEVRQPMQPVYTDSLGVFRFKGNAVVMYLLDRGGIDLNHLATVPFTLEDRMQFTQLIGYSLSGYGELSYVSDASVEAAYRVAKEGLDERDATIAYYKELVESLKDQLRAPIADLYSIHPDDLK